MTFGVSSPVLLSTSSSSHSLFHIKAFSRLFIAFAIIASLSTLAIGSFGITGNLVDRIFKISLCSMVGSVALSIIFALWAEHRKLSIKDSISQKVDLQLLLDIENIRPRESIKKFQGAKFLISNEKEIERTKAFLTKFPAEKNLFLLVGGITALDLFTSLPSAVSYFIIADINPALRCFWMKIRKCILSAESAQKAFEKIQKSFSLNFQKAFRESYEKGNFLSDAKKFMRVKELFAEGRFGILNVDYFEKENIQRFAAFLKRWKLRVHALNLSNVEDYCKCSKYDEFFGNISALISSGTIIIKTHVKENLVQKLYQVSEKEPLSSILTLHGRIMRYRLRHVKIS